MKSFQFPTVILLPIAAAGLAFFPACKPAPAPEAPKPEAPANTPPPAPPEAPPAPEKTDATPSLELQDPVATVNGESISKEQISEAFQAAVEASGVKAQDLTPDQKLSGYREILNELIMDKLVSKAAAGETVSDAEIDTEIAKIKKDFPTEDAFSAKLKEVGQTPEKLTTSLRAMLQQQRWMASQINGKDAVPEEDAKKFYDSNPTQFENPETVKASHILFRVGKDDSEDIVKAQEKAATAAAARAKKKGQDFTALAKELSEEPGAKESGGDLGFFSKDRMVPEFAEAAFNQKTGEISAPVRTQFGWHVIKVSEKKPAGTVPFEEVKDQITAYLKNSKQRETIEGILKNLRDSAEIKSTLPPANESPLPPGN